MSWTQLKLDSEAEESTPLTDYFDVFTDTDTYTHARTHAGTQAGTQAGTHAHTHTHTHTPVSYTHLTLPTNHRV